MQEQRGVYAPLIIDPAEPDPVPCDREYVVVLSDWTFEDPMAMMGKLKKQAGYFNFQQRTLGEFLSDAKKNGWRATWEDYRMWARMRMNPTDIADVTGYTYTYLMNGLLPRRQLDRPVSPRRAGAAALHQCGSAMTIFNLRIPGLPMTVVQADGQDVQPVEVDELQIAVAETYDVIVAPQEDRAYTVFAESMDRSGYARGTLAPRPGMTAAVPARCPRPLRTMDDMGMDHGRHGGTAR
ncbi:MAG: hypothetical protein MPW14_26220 (plasmid) [Candidatus Manganitrophus sp.]|nr:MAG: hypothetical protein MPW14_26220 [Candidatus Manganitrophus sp.]